MKALNTKGFVFVLAAAMVLLPSVVLPDAKKVYTVHLLVSDIASLNPDHVDLNLVNAWGIAFNSNGPVWIADNK